LAVKARRTGKRPPRRKPAAAGDAFRRLPLGSLRVFVAVAEHLHFTRAAAALGVSASATSMQVHALERYLGVTLFHRQGRFVELTAHGVQLLPRVRDGLSALQGAIDDAREVEGHGPLRVSTLGSFLTQWLMPRLPRFEAGNPGIELRIETSTELIDFKRSDIHAAIRLGAGPWAGVYSEKFMDEWLVPVCRPALLANLGPVNGHSDLKRYRLLHSSSEPWSLWLLDAPHNDVTSRISIDDSTAIVRAAEAGGGLALARWSLVADEIRSGRLALAGRQAAQYPLAYHFVCPAKHKEMPKVAAFHGWLRSEAAKHRPPGRS
jgi:LysR family transcriptional regulator, glycine cleavage system transcriptional activator